MEGIEVSLENAWIAVKEFGVVHKRLFTTKLCTTNMHTHTHPTQWVCCSPKMPLLKFESSDSSSVASYTIYIRIRLVAILSLLHAEYSCVFFFVLLLHSSPLMSLLDRRIVSSKLIMCLSELIFCVALASGSITSSLHVDKREIVLSSQWWLMFLSIFVWLICSTNLIYSSVRRPMTTSIHFFFRVWAMCN